MIRDTVSRVPSSEDLATPEQQSLFSYLLSHHSNKLCADCSQRSPTWASIDFGIFICLDCAGSHRSLGPSVTRVRSTNLDVWKKEWIYHMVLGNDIINNYLEADLVGEKRSVFKLQPDSNRTERDRFAINKYKRRKYTDIGREDPMDALMNNIRNYWMGSRVRDNLVGLEKTREQLELRDSQNQRVMHSQKQQQDEVFQVEVVALKQFNFFQDVIELPVENRKLSEQLLQLSQVFCFRPQLGPTLNTPISIPLTIPRTIPIDIPVSTPTEIHTNMPRNMLTNHIQILTIKAPDSYAQIRQIPRPLQLPRQLFPYTIFDISHSEVPVKGVHSTQISEQSGKTKYDQFDQFEL